MPSNSRPLMCSLQNRARDLRWNYQIKCGGGADSIHVATALELGCEEFLHFYKSEAWTPEYGCTSKAHAHLGLGVIEAHQTALIPAYLSNHCWTDPAPEPQGSYVVATLVSAS